MNQKKLVAFPDTNIFLHYTLFPEIEWNALANIGQITLCICPTILSELDAKKYDSGSARVRDRARIVAKRLAELIDSGAPVRPGVQIEFLSVDPTEFSAYQLNPKSQDDQFLASVIQYKSDNPESDIIVITNDIGVKLKSKARGIASFSLPESHLLTEPDPNEKKINSLEKTVARLQSQRPALKLELGEGSDRLEIIRPPELLEVSSFIQTKMDEVRKAYPKLQKPRPSHDLFRTNAFDILSGIGPSGSFASYDASLDKFFEKYEEYLSAVYTMKELRSRASLIPIQVKNFGTAPAEDVRVFVKFPSSIEMRSGEEWRRLPRKPQPPEKPTHDLPVSFLSRRDLSYWQPPSLPYPRVSLPEVLDPQRVKWHALKHDEAGWIVSFETAKLIHGYPAECPRQLYVVFASLDLFCSFKIDYEITAGNLPEKSTGSLHVIFKD